MENKSGLRPLGRAVLTDPIVGEDVVRFSKSGLALPDTVKERMQLNQQEVVVVEVGPEAWKDEKVPRAKPGDRVVVAKHAGTMWVGPADGKQYRVVNANDIFLGIDGSQSGG